MNCKDYIAGISHCMGVVWNAIVQGILQTLFTISAIENKFVKDLFVLFRVRLLTDKQTNQTAYITF